jgi:hypothetical protein
MRNDTAIYVDCLRDGMLIRTYDFLCPASLVLPAPPPADETLIHEEKGNLSIERLAAPPFEAINETRIRPALKAIQDAERELKQALADAERPPPDPPPHPVRVHRPRSMRRG